jgi:site-specific DNA-methyltransferase (adenine-specific)
MKITDKLDLHNCDCMELMQQYPDKYFDLAICDPPYGIEADENAYKNGIICKANGFKEHQNTNWDKNVPQKAYFDELQRVSKNQIIWGGNYFANILPPVASWIVWDKMQYNFSFADGELAWNSFGNKLKIFRYARGNESGFAPKSLDTDKSFSNIHPTQKPVKLYEWLLANYAKAGDKILDTHLGSASIAIACDNMGFELVGSELNTKHYKNSIERIKSHLKQGVLFGKTLPNLPKPTQPTLNFEL